MTVINASAATTLLLRTETLTKVSEVVTKL